MRFGSTIGRRLVAVAAAATLLVLAGCSNDRSTTVDLPSQADAALPDAVSTQIDDAVTRAMGLAGASGAIVGVWAPWSGYQLEAYGTTEVGGDEPMTTDMHFRAAASTKSMTCTVLLGLVDDGRLGIDDLVSDYVTIVGTEGVTLGQLCQSTSGLGDYRGELQGQFVNNPTRPWVDEELVTDGIARTGDTDPGAAFSINDTGYVLLGMALERVGGTSIGNLYEQYVFDRLGMSGSSYPGANTTTLPDPAPHGYQVIGGDCAAPRDLSEASPSMLGASGGVVTTAEDLKDFTQAFASGALFSDSTAERQWTTVPVGADAPTWQNYGYGAFEFGTMRGQYGSLPGFTTAAFSDPTTGLTVVVMLNASTASPVLARALALELSSYASTAAATGDNTTPEPSLPWSAEQQQQESASKAVCQ